MKMFAYGSNLNVDHLLQRCPEARPLGKLILHDARLVFRGVADCIYEPGSQCPGGLWEITPRCEDLLDRREGVGKGFYLKEYFEYEGEKVLHYCMTSDGIFPPTRDYFHLIKEGYRHFHLPFGPLNAAVHHAWQNKAPSYFERQRYRRTGRPVLIKLKTGTPATGNSAGISKEDA